MSNRKPAKLPWQQLVILSICRFAEPVALQSVFPYLPEMIESFGVNENDVAKWAGRVAASFSLTQCFGAIAWAWFADTFGRKPATLLGLAVTMVASLLFGFSQDLTSAFIARAIAGACSGTVGVIRTTVAEMVPEKELQPRAFSIMPLVWSIGSIIGPLLGGAFAKPAEHYPGMFGDSQLLKKYPYALPNIISAVFFVVGLIIGPLFLKETLASKKYKKDYGIVLGEMITRPCSGKRRKPCWLVDESTASQKKETKPAAAPSFSEVLNPQSNLNLLAYSILALHSIAYDQLVPVFLHLKPQDHYSNPEVNLPFKFAGGFGVDSRRTGLIFTIYGVVVMLVQFILFPPLARRYGVLYCLRVCTLAFPVAYFLTPYAVLFTNPTTQQVALFGVMLIKGAGVVFAFPCTIIMLTNSARSLRYLSTLNGLSTSLSAIGRAVGPWGAGWLFTKGDNVGWMILPWWTLGVVGIVGHISTWWLVEMDGFSGDESDDEDEDAGAQRGDESLSAQTLPPSLPEFDDEVPGAGLNRYTDGEQAIEEDEDAVEDSPLLGRSRVENAKERHRASRSDSLPPLERTLSNPVGVGIPVGGRRLSNALGHSNNGLGTGGGSFH